MTSLSDNTAERVQFSRDLDGDAEVYSMASEIRPDYLHFISRAAGEPWRISFVQAPEDLTIAEAFTYAAEIHDVLAVAQQAAQQDTGPTVGDVIDLADRLGIDAPDLFSAIARLHGEARDASDTSGTDDSPTLSDVVAAARKLGYEPSLAALEIAHDNLGSDRALRRPSDVDDRLRALDD